MIKLHPFIKYVLFGALVGALLYVVISVALYPLGKPSHCDFLCFPYWSLPSIYVMMFLSVIMRVVAPNLSINIYFTIFGAVLVYALIGAIIGALVAKIKKI